MTIRALDSWAILEWMSGRQPACEHVAKLFGDAEHGRTRLFFSAINVGEFIISCARIIASRWRRRGVKPLRHFL